MPTSTLDQTAWEESFFFCEYSKRNFELSNFNDGLIKSSFHHVISTAMFVFKENSIPIGVAVAILSEAINAFDSIRSGFKPVFKFKNLEDYIIYLTLSLPMEDLLYISNKYCVNAAYLLFPYDMNSVILRILDGEGVPLDFKFLPIERKCLIHDIPNNDYVFFGVNKELAIDEMMRLIKEQATLFKSVNNYENSELKETLISKHKNSQYAREYRRTKMNAFNKATGIHLYDLSIKDSFDREEAFRQYMSLHPSIKCDPSLQNKTATENCPCKNFGLCRNNWMKYFQEAFGKIQTVAHSDDCIDHAKKVATTQDIVRYPADYLSTDNFDFSNINKKVLDREFDYYRFFSDIA